MQYLGQLQTGELDSCKQCISALQGLRVPYSRSDLKKWELGSSQQNDCAYLSKTTAIISTKRQNDNKKGNWIYSNNMKARLNSTKDLTSMTEQIISRRNNSASTSAKGELDLPLQKGK
jgi:hypothetical protein